MIYSTPLWKRGDWGDLNIQIMRNPPKSPFFKGDLMEIIYLKKAFKRYSAFFSEGAGAACARDATLPRVIFMRTLSAISTVAL